MCGLWYVCAQCGVCVVYIWCVGMVCVWTLRFCVCATYVVSVYGIYELFVHMCDMFSEYMDVVYVWYVFVYGIYVMCM